MNLADIIRDREGFFWFVNNEFALKTGGRIPLLRIDESSISYEKNKEVIAAVVYDDNFRKVHLTSQSYFETFSEIADKYKQLTGIELEISKHYPVKKC